MKIPSWVHTWEDGSIGWSASFRWIIAHIFPMWDGASGRAFTSYERKMFLKS